MFLQGVTKVDESLMSVDDWNFETRYCVLVPFLILGRAPPPSSPKWLWLILFSTENIGTFVQM